MDYKSFFSAVGIIIGLLSSFPYIRDIFLLKTKPHIYTWLIWSITTGTAAIAAYYGNGGWGLFNLVIMTAVNLTILLMSIKYGTKNITLWDTIILAGALIAILIWWQLHQPLISILMLTAIDVLGYMPSFRKSWQEPWSETLISWFGFITADLFAILALKEYNLLTATYLIAITLANLVLYLICFARRPFIKKPI